MKNAVKFLILIFFASIALPSFALAEDKPICSCPMCSCPMMHMRGSKAKMDLDDMVANKARFMLENAPKIGLSDEQVSKIKMLKIKAKKSSIKLDADIKILALDIKEAIGKDDIDINNVNSLIDKKYTLKAQKAKDMIAAKANIKKLLTKEQLKKVKDMSASCMKGAMKQKMTERKERMPRMRMQDMQNIAD